MRVRLFQTRRDGVFYRSVWVPGVGRDQAPLRTRDREEAERLGRLLLAELLRGAPAATNGALTLGELAGRFQRECATFLDNKVRTKRGAVASIACLVGFFGRNRDVRGLSALDQSKFTTARRRGEIMRSDGRTTQPVRLGTVNADLFVLHQMLAWACTISVGSGRLLERNPLLGVKREREKNPRRPVATWERFVATRQAIAGLQVTSARASEVRRWVLIDLALVLAEATGRRLGSIRQLRWDDIDAQRSTIRWRAEADKKGVEWVIPVPESLLSQLHAFRATTGGESTLLFPSDKNPEVPMDRHLFDKWLTVAERAAGLEKLQGALWHSYRRKWASERKHHPLPDVAAAGGWKDHSTLLECYQAPDEGTLLAVMSEPAKRREPQRRQVQPQIEQPEQETAPPQELGRSHLRLVS